MASHAPYAARKFWSRMRSMSAMGSRSKPFSQYQLPMLMGEAPGSGSVEPQVRPGKGRSVRSTAQGQRGNVASSQATASSEERGSSSSHRHWMFHRLLAPMCPVPVCSKEAPAR